MTFSGSTKEEERKFINKSRSASISFQNESQVDRDASMLEKRRSMITSYASI